MPDLMPMPAPKPFPASAGSQGSSDCAFPAPVPGQLPGQLLTVVLVLVLALLLSACGAKTGAPLPEADEALAEKIWLMYQNGTEAARPSSFRDDLSLRFGTEGNTRRVTALFWGNGTSDLRLDVRAGVGATIAMISQKDGHFLIYLPMDQAAFFHQGTTSPLMKIGVPLPFDLPKLSALLHDWTGPVFGQTHGGVSTVKDGYKYELTGGVLGFLTLDGQGRVQAWRNDDWTMTLARNEEGGIQRLDLRNRRGQKAVLLVRASERPGHGRHDFFTEAQMRLELPPNTRVRALEDRLR